MIRANCDQIEAIQDVYKCKYKSTLPDLHFQQDGPSSFVIFASGGQSDLEPSNLGIEDLGDPDLKKRKIAAYKIWMGLDSHKVAKIGRFKIVEDFMVVFREARHKTQLDMIDYRKYRSDPKLKNKPPNFQQALDLLLWLHSSGFIAINFLAVRQTDADHSSDLKLDRLGLMVRKGEPVGKLQYDPYLTDPAVLQGDGSLKADPAMDFYVLGLRMYYALSDSAVFTDPVLADFFRNLEPGKFQFTDKHEVSLVLVTCYMLQANREARQDLRVLRKLMYMATEDEARAKLKQPFTYNVQDDPLKLPEFKEILAKVNLELEDASETPEWVLFALGLGGVAIVSILIFLFCRKKPEEGELPQDASKTLHDETQGGPEVVQ